MHAQSTSSYENSLLGKLGFPVPQWIVPTSVTVASLVCLAAGVWMSSPWLIAAGAVAFCVALTRWSRNRLRRGDQA